MAVLTPNASWLRSCITAAAPFGANPVRHVCTLATPAPCSSSTDGNQQPTLFLRSFWGLAGMWRNVSQQHESPDGGGTENSMRQRAFTPKPLPPALPSALIACCPSA
jgi:hypothetical protein